MRYLVVLHKDQDSTYCVAVPDLPGCFSAGETPDEALQKISEAIDRARELPSSGLPPPNKFNPALL